MHPEEIKAALRIKGITLTALASQLGLSRSMVTQVIHGYARSKKVEELIALILGSSVTEIWTASKPRLRKSPAHRHATERTA